MTDARAALVEKVARAMYERWQSTRPSAPPFDRLLASSRESEMADADVAIDLVLEEAARALYGCTRFDQEIFDSMAESRDGTYVKIEEAEAAIRALNHSS